MKMNPVVHFEMGANDKKRMNAFYTKVFGWKTNQLGPEMGEYVLVTTTETDQNQMVKTPGTINGGFYQKTADQRSQAPSIVISVDNLDQAMQKVKQNGGQILGNPQDIPGVGRWVSFRDTEDNRVSMMESQQPSRPSKTKK